MNVQVLPTFIISFFIRFGQEQKMKNPTKNVVINKIKNSDP